MALYSRHQLLVIVALIAAFGVGLGVNRWRTGNPDAVERLERFDREDMAEAPANDAAPVYPRAANDLAPAHPPAANGLAPARPPADSTAPVRPTAASGTAQARPHKLRSDLYAGGAPLDLNRATITELTALPGIGPALAARIVETRDQRPFSSLEDLRRVRGLGTAKRERLRPLVIVTSPE